MVLSREERKNALATNLIRDLQKYGLTEGQAKVYLYLIGRSHVNARTISANLTLHRVDVYRKLRELEDLGLVETYLGFPKKFSAVSADIALPVLLRRMESKIKSVRNSSNEIKQKLKQYKRDNQLEDSNADPDSAVSREMYKFVVGRKRYYHEVHSMLRNAKKEILRIISANGIKRIFLSQFYKDYVRAKARGVEIKMISEINNENCAEAKKLSRLFELRHLNNVHVRLAVVDQRITAFGARLDDENLSGRTGDDSYLFSNDPRLAETARFLFEHLWSSAKHVSV